MGRSKRVLTTNSVVAELRGRPWRVDMVWVSMGGRAECVGLTLRSFEVETENGRPPVVRDGDEVLPVGGDFEPVGSEVLRAFRMSTVERARRRWRQLFEGELRKAADPATRLAFRRTGVGKRLVGADGLPLPTNEALREVARIYSDAASGPTRAVADALHISRSAAAKRVARARQAGLLPETEAGRARRTTEEI